MLRREHQLAAAVGSPLQWQREALQKNQPPLSLTKDEQLACFSRASFTQQSLDGSDLLQNLVSNFHIEEQREAFAKLSLEGWGHAEGRRATGNL
ncbi:hypothetical protein cyc_01269 [Cyclospora cayetanensis]|uniref:Uncharacterized protein n=1 Tax=Cyclospora cayetanensis TaxID=88456 RepID=A0A1D3D107_9EIME|nr:hypothetical protein cyc_01269 [Cyclospora cayetanensis]